MTIRPRRVSPVLLSLVVSLFLLQPLQAIDQVLRKSSKTPIRGKITAVAKTGVTVKPQVGQDVTVPANDIKDVRWNGEPVKLITARISDHAGRYDRALVIYAEAQADPKASAANIKLDLQFLIGEIETGADQGVDGRCRHLGRIVAVADHAQADVVQTPLISLE